MSRAATGAVAFSITRIGDLVMATVTFSALRARYGQVRVVTSPAAAPLLLEDDRLGAVEVMPHTGPLAWRAAVVARLLQARRRGEVVVNLEVYGPRWRLVHRVAGALGILGHELDLPALRAEERGSAEAGHMARFYADAMALEDVPPLSLRPGARGEAQAAQVLERAGVPGQGPLVVIHPGSHAGWPGKRAGSDLYAGVSRILSQRAEARILLVGGPEEAPLCDEVLARSGEGARMANLAGQLPLSALPSVLRRARVFVGNDSGPLKIAEAVGTPTVSFWTATRPDRLGPRGPGHRTFVLEDADVPPTEAAEAVLELMGEPGTGGAGA